MSVGRRLRVVGVILIVAFLVVSVLQLGSATLSVSEVVERRESYLGKYVKVLGLVAKPWELGGQEIRFRLVDENDASSSIEVVYSGPLPANWHEGLKVIVSGKFVEPGWIRADQVLSECPGRYRP